ncbi:MAG TPA: hypothetical protein VE988_13325, partial [Gemmataceae bacterium]|nr:hypothetical protein [Gemmataceae bacterium]
MALSWLKQMVKWKFRTVRNKRQQRRFVPSLEWLGERIAPAVTASFAPATNILTVLGDAQN